MTLMGHRRIVSSPSPAFTGSLGLDTLEEVRNVMHQPLDPLNVLHFLELAFLWDCEGYLLWVTVLVLKFSGTFGPLDFRYRILCVFVLVLCRNCDLPSFIGESSPVSIELSKVAILGEVER